MIADFLHLVDQWSPVIQGVSALAGLFVAGAILRYTAKQDSREDARLESEMDQAYRVLRVETARIYATRLYWQEEGIVEGARNGIVRAEGVEPPDWALVASAIAKLGPQSAGLGGTALANLQHASAAAHNFVALAAAYERAMAKFTGPESKEELEAFEGEYDKNARDLQQKIVLLLTRAEEELEDALILTPQSDAHAEWRHDPRLKSEFAKAIGAELTGKQEIKSGASPTGSNPSA